MKLVQSSLELQTIMEGKPELLLAKFASEQLPRLSLKTGSTTIYSEGYGKAENFRREQAEAWVKGSESKGHVAKLLSVAHHWYCLDTSVQFATK